MFEFGDELTLESDYKIPWLIWIQILVLFLLIFLLYFVSISPLDLQETSISTTSPQLNTTISTVFTLNRSQVRNLLFFFLLRLIWMYEMLVCRLCLFGFRIISHQIKIQSEINLILTSNLFHPSPTLIQS